MPSDALLQVHVRHLAQVNGDVRMVRELPANGDGDIGRIQACGGDLVQERLEEVVVPLIQEGHVDSGWLRERLRGGQTCETRLRR